MLDVRSVGREYQREIEKLPQKILETGEWGDIVASTPLRTRNRVAVVKL